MIKKLIFSTLIGLASINVQAQTNNTDFLKEIKGITAYNATILGYGIYCDFPKEKIDKIKNQFLSTLQQVKLLPKDELEVKKVFLDTLAIAKEKGPEHTGMVCFTFKSEFEKIYDAVNTGKVRQ